MSRHYVNKDAQANGETTELSKGTHSFLQGRGEKLTTTESEDQILQRVVPELMSMKSIMILNDEAHHCYRENLAKRKTTSSIRET